MWLRGSLGASSARSGCSRRDECNLPCTAVLRCTVCVGSRARGGGRTTPSRVRGQGLKSADPNSIMKWPKSNEFLDFGIHTKEGGRPACRPETTEARGDAKTMALVIGPELTPGACKSEGKHMTCLPTIKGTRHWTTFGAISTPRVDHSDVPAEAKIHELLRQPPQDLHQRSSFLHQQIALGLKSPNPPLQ